MLTLSKPCWMQTAMISLMYSDVSEVSAAFINRINDYGLKESTSVYVYQPIRLHIPEDNNPYLFICYVEFQTVSSRMQFITALILHGLGG